MLEENFVVVETLVLEGFDTSENSVKLEVFEKIETLVFDIEVVELTVILETEKSVMLMVETTDSQREQKEQPEYLCFHYAKKQIP